LTHNEITSGGTLKLVMGATPNKAWGSSKNVRPPATMPEGYKYSELPPPSVEKKVTLTVPIRVACAEDDDAGNFTPDSNMLQGGTNRKDTKIDTSNVPNPAPEAVYQSERYSDDFTYTYEVPKDGRYLVRLHFAELFDNAADMRVENIEINGNMVLKDFDIFKAAGGLNKAVVREFKDITPDKDGKIAIRITAAPQSPDKNAKISGLEILKAE
jgi:hypothetical protein